MLHYHIGIGAIISSRLQAKKKKTYFLDNILELYFNIE